MSRWWVFLILAIPFQFLWADEVTVEVVDKWLRTLWPMASALIFHWWMCKVNEVTK